ncbi:MAG: LSM domain-containing protein [Candidatus Ranarchaeia archaeon]
MFQPLEKYITSRIQILMTNGAIVRGILQGYDRHLNIFISKGELEDTKSKLMFGDMILRGASILAVAEDLQSDE